MAAGMVTEGRRDRELDGEMRSVVLVWLASDRQPTDTSEESWGGLCPQRNHRGCYLTAADNDDIRHKSM